MQLRAREYKLLLRSDLLGDHVDTEAAGRFRERLAAIARSCCLDLEGAFARDPLRAVRFFDVPGRSLTGRGFSLQSRRAETGTGPGEVVLGLRSPDRFVVAAAELPGRSPGATTSFEEDISPLEVQSQGRRVTVADPPSIRTRFVLSTTVEGGQALDRLSDALDLFPTLGRYLGPPGEDEPLIAGSAIHEKIFRGPRIGLRSGFVADAALTFWTFDPPLPVPRIAEVSFRVVLRKGRMSAGAARQAIRLFAAMQTDLPPELRSPSKTALALPPERPA